MKSALIIGGESAIGSAIANACQNAGIHIERTSRRPEAKVLSLDLAKAEYSWPNMPPVDVAYVCAAIAKLDVCETQPTQTSFVNVQQTRTLCARLIAQGTHIVFFSSNHVFDGAAPMRRTTERISPQSQYGQQKAALESYLLSQQGSVTVLRLTKVVTRPWPLIQRWKSALQNGGAISAFTDLVFAPIPLAEVVASAITLGAARHTGIFHLSGTEDISYYEAATQFAQSLSLDLHLVQPVAAADHGIPLQLRPLCTTLLTSSSIVSNAIPPPMELLLSDNGIRNRGLEGEALDF
jgi:dTDP-4-dehydrorhamnose reductase